MSVKRTLIEFNFRHGACRKCEKWVSEQAPDITWEEVWDDMPPLHIIWAVSRPGVGILTQRELRLLTVYLEREVLKHAPMDGVAAVLDVAERYANGDATDEELREARQTSPRLILSVVDDLGHAAFASGLVLQRADSKALARAVKWLRENTKPDLATLTRLLGS